MLTKWIPTIGTTNRLINLPLNDNPFQQPTPLEHSIYFRPGMGTEAVSPLLRSLVQMVRPNRILEIGGGYTTPFLLQGLVNNEFVFDDGNLDPSYFIEYKYEAKLVVIDDMSQGKFVKQPGMEEIFNSKYVDYIEGLFQGKSQLLYKKYRSFDFVWFDCGSRQEYLEFFDEYWSICSKYVIFHYTYSDGRPNKKYETIYSKISKECEVLNIIEPHKKRQGSITIVKKPK